MRHLTRVLSAAALALAASSLPGRSDEIAFEVRLYRSRARLADLAEAAWEATANRKA